MKKRDIILICISLFFGFFYYIINNVDYGFLNSKFSFLSTSLDKSNSFQFKLYESTYSSITNLNIKNSAGSIDIDESLNNELSILITCSIHAKNEKRARELLEKLKLLKEVSSTKICISTDSIQPYLLNFVRFHIIVKAPRSISINVSNSFGTIKLNDVGKDIFFKVNKTDIYIKNIVGNVVINGNYSNISIYNAKCSIRLKCEFSNLQLEEIDSINIESKYGNNSIKNVHTKIQVIQTFGSLSILNAKKLNIDSKNTTLKLKHITDYANIIGKNKRIEIEELFGNLFIFLENCHLYMRYGTIPNGSIFNSSGMMEISDISGLNFICAVKNGSLKLKKLKIRDRIDINSAYSDIYFTFSEDCQPSLFLKNEFGKIFNNSHLILKPILFKKTYFILRDGMYPSISINSLYGDVFFNKH